MLTYLVPSDTRRHVESGIKGCRNLSLILARYLPDEAVDPEATYPDHQGRPQRWRQRWLQETIGGQKITNGDDVGELIRAEYSRWAARTAGAATFTGRLQSRMIVGLGDKGPLEIGITLKPLTGLPMIPGSALKGLCRAYAVLTLAAAVGIPLRKPGSQHVESGQSAVALFDAWLSAGDNHQKQVLNRLNNALAAANKPQVVSAQLAARQDVIEFREVFGTQEHAGACVFHEACLVEVPKSGRLFELDVMTPHFNRYYQNGGAPADDDRPVPILFIAVAQRARFAFAIARRGGASQQAVERAERWLKAALFELGAGSKTAAGYGVFDVD